MNRWKVLSTDKRRTRMIHFIANAAGTALSGPDSDLVTMTDTGTGVKTITLDKPFASSTDYTVQVTTATANTVAQVSITSSSVFVINTFQGTDGTTATDAIVHVLVIGKDKTSLA